MSAVEARDIWKSFFGTAALRGASLSVESNSIHALIGENGAGKSTLIKVLTGVHRADRGTVTTGGQKRHFESPQAAIESGISAVFQERNLVPDFSVAENLFLHKPPRRVGFLNYDRLYADAGIWLARVGLALHPETRAGDLSVAQGQLVEIARALALEARVLLLDEPTASITEREAGVLFERLRELRDAGSAILFVSHKLDEVFALCDRITVIRDGETILDSVPRSDLTQKDVVTAMVGRSITFSGKRLAASDISGEAVPRLELRKLATRFGHDGIEVAVRAGEVVGLYGLVGAGRTELARAVVGLEPVTDGTILRDGKSVHVRDPRAALHTHRIGYVSEDRKGEGIILSHPIRQNVGITIWNRIQAWFGYVTPERERQSVGPVIDKLGVRHTSIDQAVGQLSGGNQQKISVAKWLASDVDVLIIDEPTIGIDVRTKEDMYALIEALAAEGKAILVISSDLVEMVRITDRILVMARKRLVLDVVNSGNYAALSERIMHAIV
jgi:ribose transport system ATP-binding protein